MSQQREVLLKLPAVKAATAISRSTIYSLEASGHFPKRVAIGPRAVAWRDSEVQAWINSRKTKAIQS